MHHPDELIGNAKYDHGIVAMSCFTALMLLSVLQTLHKLYQLVVIPYMAVQNGPRNKILPAL